MHIIKQIFSKLSVGKYIPKYDKTKIDKFKNSLNYIKYQEFYKELDKLSKKSYKTISKLLEALKNEYKKLLLKLMKLIITLY